MYLGRHLNGLKNVILYSIKIIVSTVTSYVLKCNKNNNGTSIGVYIIIFKFLMY